MTDKDFPIYLNPHWLAVRSENKHWSLYRKLAKGQWKLEELLEGPRRRIFEIMDDFQIVPTPKALQIIDGLPETAGFPLDPDEEEPVKH